MITLTIILSIILLFLLGILFIPLRIVVKTKTKEYYIKLPGYFRVDLIFRDEIVPVIRLKLFLFSFHIEPGRKSRKKKEKGPDKMKKTKTKVRIRNPFKFFMSCLKQFKIKKLHAEIDTGDFPLNAQLIPLANAVNKNNISLNINFENRNQINFCTTIQTYKFLFLFIKYSMFNK